MSALSIRDKLGKLSAKTEAAAPVRREDAQWERLGFATYHNHFGEFLVREEPVTDEVLFHLLPGQVWAKVGKSHHLAEIDMNRMCFLDLETTGLNLGAGGFAFAIGCAYISPEGSRLRQYFLRNHTDERAALLDLTSFLEQFRGLVTYNGRSFDWPLLCDRFNFNRMKYPALGELHLDLLHAARRIWRGVLPSFSLKEVEFEILGKERIDDIPGYLIPAAYLNFLRSGKTTEIEQILEHNFNDIVSLQLMAHRMGSVFLGVHQCEHHAEIANAADIFAQLGHIEDAVRYLEHLIAQENCPGQVFSQLARIHKKQGNHRLTVDLWWEAADRDEMAIEPWIELAKHFEHREKNHETARECTIQAIRLRREHGHAGRYADDRALQKRLQRLENKIKTSR
ncbi:MAG: ribonuclease H-like domain-containing protein [Candidatus Saccharibacteria bacterium]